MLFLYAVTKISAVYPWSKEDNVNSSLRKGQVAGQPEHMLLNSSGSPMTRISQAWPTFVPQRVHTDLDS
ncbi:hypothetical protein D3C75_780480 [compost metagenome]